MNISNKEIYEINKIHNFLNLYTDLSPSSILNLILAPNMYLCIQILTIGIDRSRCNDTYTQSKKWVYKSMNECIHI